MKRITGNPARVGPLLTAALLAAAACVICAMSDGVKNNYGIMLSAVIENSGLSYASVSLVLALGQLVYGLVQPFFGILAQKKGSTATLLAGASMMLAGILLLPFCTSAISLTLCLGLLLPSGTGAVSYGILIGSISPGIPERHISLASGFVNASSGVGNALLSPVIQSLLASYGIAATMMVLAVPTMMMIPLVLFIGKADKADCATRSEKPARPVRETSAPPMAAAMETFSDALRSRSYLLLMAGFFTCGFHMVLIANHLPYEITTYGISAKMAAYAFSLYGFVTMAGSVLSGWLTGKLRMKNVLAAYYGLRSVIVLAFLLLPKTEMCIFGFAFLLGMTGAATVPPVSGLIGKAFGAARVGTLYGLVFLVHSIGGFFGAWLGGVFAETFGGYTEIWAADIVLCAFAAAASWLIRDRY